METKPKYRLYYMFQELQSASYRRRYIKNLAKTETTDDPNQALIYESEKAAGVAKDYCKLVFRKRIGIEKEIEK